jgi:hypothetical protein
MLRVIYHTAICTQIRLYTLNSTHYEDVQKSTKTQKPRLQRPPQKMKLSQYKKKDEPFIVLSWFSCVVNPIFFLKYIQCRMLISLSTPQRPPRMISFHGFRIYYEDFIVSSYFVVRKISPKIYRIVSNVKLFFFGTSNSIIVCKPKALASTHTDILVLQHVGLTRHLHSLTCRWVGNSLCGAYRLLGKKNITESTFGELSLARHLLT